jgi:hypothetical protein
MPIENMVHVPVKKTVILVTVHGTSNAGVLLTRSMDLTNFGRMESC